MKAYFISGIGADYRLFKNVVLPDGFEAEYIHWIDPLKNESIPSYAERLSQKIITTEPFILVGLSLGGIMATEISKFTQPVCTVIISSVPSNNQLPPYFIFVKKLKLHRLIHPQFVKFTATCKHYLTTKGMENKKFMRQLIRDGNDRFISWGINAVLNWKNDTIPDNLFHIHGTRDEVFPIKYTKPHYTIKGGHMLVFNQGKELNFLLEQILKPICHINSSAKYIFN